MTVDTEGRIYLAARSAEPARRPRDRPDRQGSGLHQDRRAASRAPRAGRQSRATVDFGIGDEKNVLYITVDKSLYRIRLNATGYHIPWAR